jgi:hypothetical protein
MRVSVDTAATLYRGGRPCSRPESEGNLKRVTSRC